MKPDTYYKRRCKDCAYLCTDDDGDWACDNGADAIAKCAKIISCSVGDIAVEPEPNDMIREVK